MNKTPTSLLMYSREVSAASSTARFTRESLVDLTVILWLCNAPLKMLVHIPLSAFGLSSLTMLAAGVITYIPLMLYVVMERRLPCKWFIVIFLLVAAFFGVTLLNHPDYQAWYDRDLFGVGYTVFRPDHGALWAVLMVELCGSGERLLKNLKVASIVIFFHNLLLAYSASKTGYWTYYTASGLIGQRSYDLDFGYNMVFVAMVAMVCALRERKRYMWLVVVGCVLLDLRFGSRGSLICIAAMILLWVAFSETAPVRKLGAVVCIVAFAAVFLANAQDILQTIAYFLQDSFGLESRTITSILQGEALDDSGRDAIYDLVNSALTVNPYGYGAYGDRPIIGPYFYWGYCHNVFLELSVNFGVAVAVVILAVLLGASFFSMFRTRDSAHRVLIMICLSMCMRLLVSDTFWGNDFFWMLIGILLIYRNNKGRDGGDFRREGSR